MTGGDFVLLLPLLIPAYTGVLLMLVVPYRRSHGLAFTFAFAGIAAGMTLIPTAATRMPGYITPLLRMDALSLYFTGLVFASGLLVTLLSRDYMRGRRHHAPAFYILILFAVAGMEIIVLSAHFASFFLGLETLSVALYGMIGYSRGHKPSLEGAMKYLILAGSASAFLLLGVAFIYADLGSLEFGSVASAFAGGSMSPLSVLGLALVLVLFGFKLALAPFHMWSPDIYQGAPAPTTALIATGSKGAVLAVLLKLFLTWTPQDNPTAYSVIAVLAIATMFTGNLLALMQTNLKRMLAYSSIAHMGYLLIPLPAGGAAAASPIAFYLAAYFAAVIAAFGVIAVTSTLRPAGDLQDENDYRGLGLRHPFLAGVLVLALISLTGVPPTAGFLAKFYIFSTALRAGLWGLVVVGIVNSGISAFYYLRVILAVYSPRESELPETWMPRTAGGIALATSAAAILLLGIYPAPLIRLTEAISR